MQRGTSPSSRCSTPTKLPCSVPGPATAFKESAIALLCLCDRVFSCRSLLGTSAPCLQRTCSYVLICSFLCCRGSGDLRIVGIDPSKERSHRVGAGMAGHPELGSARRSCGCLVCQGYPTAHVQQSQTELSYALFTPGLCICSAGKACIVPGCRAVHCHVLAVPAPCRAQI